MHNDEPQGAKQRIEESEPIDFMKLSVKNSLLQACNQTRGKIQALMQKLTSLETIIGRIQSDAFKLSPGINSVRFHENSWGLKRDVRCIAEYMYQLVNYQPQRRQQIEEIIKRAKQKVSMLDKVQRLKILFVTDIHLNQTAMQKLSQWADMHHNSEPKFDYLFIGGDTANCDHSTGSQAEEQMFIQTQETHLRLKDIFNCKLFFVPGNHDCKCFFKPGYHGEGLYNMHNRRVELSAGLELLGFGGSVPAYQQQKQVWEGYPYQSQKDLQAEWAKGKLAAHEFQPDKQYIMFTHVGPKESETSINRADYPEGRIVSGSEYLNRFIGNKGILCWLHGHTHEGSNYSRIAGTEIINPGPLKAEKFMHFELVRVNNRWQLGRKVFETL